MARVNGRTVLPTCMAEKVVLEQLGISTLRVPRAQNPYQVARRLKRAAGPHPDVEYLRAIAVRTRPVVAPHHRAPGATAQVAGGAAAEEARPAPAERPAAEEPSAAASPEGTLHGELAAE